MDDCIVVVSKFVEDIEVLEALLTVKAVEEDPSVCCVDVTSTFDVVCVLGFMFSVEIVDRVSVDWCIEVVSSLVESSAAVVRSSVLVEIAPVDCWSVTVVGVGSSVDGCDCIVVVVVVVERSSIVTEEVPVDCWSLTVVDEGSSTGGCDCVAVVLVVVGGSSVVTAEVSVNCWSFIVVDEGSSVSGCDCIVVVLVRSSVVIEEALVVDEGSSVGGCDCVVAVSYTHLTLPTICSV